MLQAQLQEHMTQALQLLLAQRLLLTPKRMQPHTPISATVQQQAKTKLECTSRRPVQPSLMLQTKRSELLETRMMWCLRMTMAKQTTAMLHISQMLLAVLTPAMLGLALTARMHSQRLARRMPRMRPQSTCRPQHRRRLQLGQWASHRPSCRSPLTFLTCR